MNIKQVVTNTLLYLTIDESYFDFNFKNLIVFNCMILKWFVFVLNFNQFDHIIYYKFSKFDINFHSVDFLISTDQQFIAICY